ncbi:carboxymuconolactone decarboxylase family protein [Deinococcus ruber]|uniref:4-carboxymuconolactone decarboxylase n=1 Tax=Deinococcus ruber TaxID=1848197 RepID=A0A918F3S4_9DEIO|nr:carboxymuconolactone decarboxylase family protein [Deinococcus ruber]GGQ98491.1 4-carboxymuconolactone decarboxylase [Deinococcus ruber]
MSDSDDTPRHARHTVFGRQHDRIFERLSSLDPDLSDYIRDFAYDTVYDRGGLDLKTQELLACTLLLTLGSPDELKTHLRGAMLSGATEAEVRETLLFAAPFVGFPKVVAAFGQLKSLLDGKQQP